MKIDFSKFFPLTNRLVLEGKSIGPFITHKNLNNNFGTIYCPGETIDWFPLKTEEKKESRS